MNRRILLHASGDSRGSRMDRVAALSRAVSESVEGVSILIATDSEGMPWERLPANADYVRLPARRFAPATPVPGTEGPGSPPAGRDAAALPFEVLRATMRRFPPEVFVLDVPPGEVSARWLGFLRDLGAASPTCRRVLIAGVAWLEASGGAGATEVRCEGVDEIWILPGEGPDGAPSEPHLPWSATGDAPASSSPVVALRIPGIREAALRVRSLLLPRGKVKTVENPVQRAR